MDAAAATAAGAGAAGAGAAPAGGGGGRLEEGNLRASGLINEPGLGRPTEPPTACVAAGATVAAAAGGAFVCRCSSGQVRHFVALAE